MARYAELIDAQDLSRRHPGKDEWLLDGVTLQLSAGDRLYLSGQAGSGKTLLLRSLALLDPMDRGEVRWRGEAVTDVPAYRSKVMLLPQQPVLFEGNVEQNLQTPFLFRVHQGCKYDKDRVLDYLCVFGRDESFLEKRQSELSGGEIQMTALARALQFDPDVLLLDEPTAALDADNVAAVEELVTRWQQQKPNDRAFIWVTHQSQQGRRLANRVATMNRGRLAEQE